MIVSNSNIEDLPDEILFIIINTLNIGEVYYSFVDINNRFNQLILDPIYIRNLNMTMMTMKSFYDRTFSIDDQVLSKICENILPRIHHHVHRLTVEQDTIDRILIQDYPQLYSLSLIKMEEKKLFQYLEDKSSMLYNLLNKQVTHLNIVIQDEKMSSKIFHLILSVCPQLTQLILSVCPRFTRFDISNILAYRNKPIFTSRLSTTSNLTELKINLTTLDDCLYLLNGKLNHLSKLTVHVKKISRSFRKINNRTKLPKLKYFSLTSMNSVHCYDDNVTALLRRMINLEELILFLSVTVRDKSVIDGNHLFDNVLIHLPRLNKFTFSINTAVMLTNDINFPSNEDLQRSFIGRGYGQVGSYVFPNSVRPEHLQNSPISYIKKAGRCHVYSLPFEFKHFLDLSNLFPGGIFDKVEYLEMQDLRSFEFEFFELIAQDFPSLKQLIINNIEPQKNKQYPSRLIKFPHLILLDLSCAHVDYTELFLCGKNTYLPCLLDICIQYKRLKMVTNNFTNEATRFYCAKLKGLHIGEPFVPPEHFLSYFPLL